MSGRIPDIKRPDISSILRNFKILIPTDSEYSDRFYPKKIDHKVGRYYYLLYGIDS